MIKDYVFPKSVEEAVDVLRENDGGAVVISGGTDLIIRLEEEAVTAEVLVDVTRIDGFRDIAFEDGLVVIGAGVTMADIHENERIASNVGSLAKAAGSVGSAQIRNSATLTGNIVNAQPAADSAVMAAALGAELIVRGAGYAKTVPVQDAYLGFGQSVIDNRKEVVTKIVFKEPQGNQGTGYARMSKRKALSRPTLNVGAMISVSGGAIEWARITMGPVGVGPVRALEAENFLAGKEPSEANLKEAGILAAKDANPRSSLLRGPREYRLAVLPSLVTKALNEAIDEIKTKGGM